MQSTSHAINAMHVQVHLSKTTVGTIPVRSCGNHTVPTREDMCRQV